MLALVRQIARRPARLVAGVVLACSLSGAVAGPANAAPYAGIVIDGKTGKILYQSDPDGTRYPASLTKMMTLYMLFGALESGDLTLSSRLRVSANAAAQPPSKLGVKAGETIAVKDAILALVTRSANDVAVVVAENLSGSEAEFARRMTATARAIGMSRTTFRNASGLPNSEQVSTARDLATLGLALRDRFPQYYDFFSTRRFVWEGRTIATHNRLLGRVDGVDGIKTGYTRASGFNLVTSVKTGNRYIVAVVLGGKTGRSRDAQMAKLVDERLRLASTGTRTTRLLVASAAPLPIAAAKMDVAPKPKPGETAVPLTIASVVASVGEAEGDAEDDDPPGQPSAAADGWKIQIGALPSDAGAKSMIDRAQSSAPALLGKLTPYVEPVDAGKTTLYRARFAGFASKDAARAACTSLKKMDFACLAVP